MIRQLLSVQHEETNHINVSLEHRFHELEVQHTEAITLLHLQGTLIIDLQVYPSSHALYFPCLFIFYYSKM